MATIGILETNSLIAISKIFGELTTGHQLTKQFE